MKVCFYETIADEKLAFAVIVARYKGKWLFVRYHERDTYEIPGGHREAGESIEDTAKRELQEESGADRFCIRPLCVYSVIGKTRVNPEGKETFGMLYIADIRSLRPLCHETAAIILSETLPAREQLTYPLIQPQLFAKAQELLNKEI